MPGVGWVVAILALVVVSVLAPFSGRRYVSVTLVVSGIHLFTVGPLSLLGQSGPDWPPVAELVIFVILPIVIALASVFVPIYFSRKE